MSGTTERPGRVVVVVGGSSGIGRATARLFTDRGDSVVLVARSEQALRETAAELPAGQVLVVPGDVLSEDDMREVVRRSVAELGRIDVWVHSAAVMSYGRFEDTPPEIFRGVMDTEFYGVVHAARAVLPQLRVQGAGTLIVVNSLLGMVATPYMAPYVASKWGLRGLTRVLDIEMRDVPGVRVCSVSPGAVNTPVYEQGATYTGWIGRPPPPVVSPERIARAIVRTADRPRRDRSVPFTNALMVFGYRRLPAVYDALVTPLLRVGGLSRRPSGPTPGNVLTPRPELERVHGPWDGRWLRRVAVGIGVASTAAGATVLTSRRSTGPV